MSIAVLFIIVINWNQPIVHQLKINKLIMVYLHNGILHGNKNINHCYMQQHKRRKKEAYYKIMPAIGFHSYEEGKTHV